MPIWNLESLVEFTDLLNLTRFLPFVTKVKKLAVSFCGMHLLNSDEKYCVCKLRLQFRTLILQKLTCHFFHKQLSHKAGLPQSNDLLTFLEILVD